MQAAGEFKVGLERTMMKDEVKKIKWLKITMMKDEVKKIPEMY